MIPTQLRKFVRELIDATSSGRVTWFEADYRAYFCNQHDVTLHIRIVSDSIREQEVIMFRVESRGSSTPFSVSEYEDDYSTMKTLYESVVASANDVGTVIRGFFD